MFSILMQYYSDHSIGASNVDRDHYVRFFFFFSTKQTGVRFKSFEFKCMVTGKNKHWCCNI